MLTKLNNIIESLPIVIFKWKNESGWPVDFVTKNVFNLIGYTVDELTSKEFDFSSLIYPNDLERVTHEIILNSESEIENFEHSHYRLIKKDGSIIWVNDRTQIIKDDTGKIIEYVGYLVDITEKVKLENKLKRSQENYKRIFALSPIGIFIANIDGKIISSNRSFQNMLGYTEEELKDHSILEITHKFDINDTSNVIKAVIEKNKIEKKLEKRYITKNGQIIIAQLNINRVWNDILDQYVALASIEDITEKKKTEELLIDQYSLFNMLLEVIPGPVFYKNSNGQYLGFNKKFEEFVERSYDEIINKTVFDISVYRDALLLNNEDMMLIENMGTIQNEIDVTIKGKVKYAAYYKTAFKLTNQSEPIILTIVLDITSKKQFEYKLKQINRNLEIISKTNLSLLLAETQNELFFAICEILVTLGDYPLVFISELCILDNGKYELKYKNFYSKDNSQKLELNQYISINSSNCIVANSASSNKTIYQNIDGCNDCPLSKLYNIGYKSLISIPINNKSKFKYNLNLFLEDSILLNESEFTLLEDISNYLGYGIDSLHDSEQRKNLQEIINNEKNELDTIINNIDEGIISFNSYNVIQLMNSSAKKILNININLNINEINLLEIFRIVENEDLYSFNPMDLVAQNQNENVQKHKMTIITKEKIRKEIEYQISEINDKNGLFIGLIFVFNDITDILKHEAQRSLSQKMESIGQLASGIAHEINTPLQYVGDNIFFLKKAFDDIMKFIQYYQDDMIIDMKNELIFKKAQKIYNDYDFEFILEEIPNALDSSLNGIEKVSSIVKAMKNFAHSSDKKKSYENINNGIEVTVTISRNEWKYSSDIELNLDSDIPMILCSLDEINQVILNMIINSAHANEEKFGRNKTEKGKIFISTHHHNENVSIIIEDSGTGIPKNKIDRIFDPFFTTKEVGKGTGQGLAISHDIIVNKHSGKIFVDSVMGQGTKFTINLPIKNNNE